MKISQLSLESFEKIAPKCAHFGECGGCLFQHISYADQLNLKEAFVKQIFSSSAPLDKIMESKSPWHYRNKMEYTFSEDRKGNKFLGLMKKGVRGVINLHECYLTNPWFIDTLGHVRKWWEQSTLTAFRPNSATGSLRTLTLREGMQTGDRMAMLTVSGDPAFALRKKDITSFAEAVGDISVFIRIHQAIKGHPTQFFEMHLKNKDHIEEHLRLFQRGECVKTFRFKVGPQSFFQPNTFAAEALYDRAFELIGLKKEDTVLDLFSGTGTLAIFASFFAKEVIGVELSKEAVVDAGENIKLNGIGNVKMVCEDVGAWLKREKVVADAVIIDPPRAGLDKVAMQALKDIKPAKILYISCNPLTQKENVEELCAMGYKIQAIQPVDQFPQAGHVENIVVLLL